jgi:uncharacterized protein (TIRG00374 family)
MDDPPYAPTDPREGAAMTSSEHPPPSEGSSSPQDVTVPPILETPSPSPFQVIVRWALVALVMYLIFGVLIPSFADYSDVWDALTSLEPGAVVLLVVLAMTVEAAKAASYTVLTSGLPFRWAFVAQEQAVVVSNTVPGPSGTAARYISYRKFGVSQDDFGRSYVVNSAWSNGFTLLLPGVALLLLSTQQDVPGRIVALALVGLAVSLAGLVIAVMVMRSERFAYRFGEWFGRLLNWGRGLVKRPPEEDVGNAVVRFRFEALSSVRDHWASLTVLVLLKDFATFLALLTSLRALGAQRVDLTVLEIFAVYAVVRLAAMVEITPGGVGVVETLYIAALLWASDGQNEAAIVAAVFVFRIFTYLLPILVGGICWLILARHFRRTGAVMPSSGPTPA